MSTFGTLLRIEFIKARRRLALWLILGFFAAFIVVPILQNVVQAIGGGAPPGPPFALPWLWRAVLLFPSNMGPFFIAVAMILLFAPEFGWKTARQNVIDGLAREHLFLGKLIVFGILLAVFFVLPIVTGVVASIVSPDPTGTFARAVELNHMAGYFLALLLWGSLAILLATLLRGSGAAIGIMFLYLLVESAVSSVAALWNEGLEKYLNFLPTRLFDTLTRIELYYPDELARTNQRREALGQELMELPDYSAVVVAVLAYAVLFLGVAFLGMRRRDL